MRRRHLSFFFLTLILSLLLTFPGQGRGAERTPGKKARAEAAAKKKAAAEAEQKAAAEAAASKGTSLEPSPGPINARSAVLAEISTGKILFEYNPDEPIEPASFTKILSLYLIFEGIQQGNIRLSDEIFISESAWRTAGSKMFVDIGSKIPLEEILKGIAVISGNDACVAAAEHLYGSQEAFVDAMNKKARQLGMDQSRFLNPHGLPAEGQITTARDMATLDVAYLQRFPESLRFHSIREYTYNNIVQYNRNHLLLKDPSVDGLKTGFVNASGYHLAATAQRDGMRLLAVVMGASSPSVREREALKLLNFGFRYYALVQPFPQDQPLSTVKVWKGQKDSLNLYPVEAASFLIPQAQRNQLRWEVRAPSEITAPVSTEQTFGEVVFYVADQPKKNIPLKAHEEIAQAGWFKRIWQSFLHVPKLDWRWVSGIIGGFVLIGFILLFLSGRRSRRRSSLSG